MYKISVIFYMTFIFYIVIFAANPDIFPYIFADVLLQIICFFNFLDSQHIISGFVCIKNLDLVFKILRNHLPKNLTFFLNFSLQKLQSPDALGVTITRCVAVMYLYFQFRDLKKMGSRYLLGKHSLFVCNL